VQFNNISYRQAGFVVISMRPFITQSGKYNSGFTLIELIVVIAIISVMAGMGSGAFIGMINRMKLDKTANSLLLAARYARAMAVEQQSRYRLCLDKENAEFFLVTTFSNSQDGEVADAIVNDPYCRPVQLDGTIEFEDIEIISTGDTSEAYEDLPTVVFRQDGTADTAVIQIGNGKTSYTVSINAATGRAKMINGVAKEVTISTKDLDSE
jgi:prepilin-type N-terminal cleavage/methylation domain-containing protein